MGKRRGGEGRRQVGEKEDNKNKDNEDNTVT